MNHSWKMRTLLVTVYGVLLLINYYVFLRLWQMMPMVFLGRILLITVAALIFLAFNLYPFVHGKLPSSIAAWVHRIATGWLPVLFYLLLVFLFLDGLNFIKLLPGDMLHGNGSALASLVGSMILIFLCGYVNYSDKKRVELNINTAGKIRDEKPIRAVALSDMHLGYGIGAEELRRWIAMINREQPDVVLIAGDLVDFHVRPLREQNMDKILGAIEAKFGVYCVLGNHDYLELSQTLEFLKSSKVIPLRDSSILVNDQFYIVGRDEYSQAPRKPLGELVESLDKSKLIILLDHQPRDFQDAVMQGVNFQFSGHVHRGQFWPISLMVKWLFDHAYGYVHQKNSHFYVSSGIGIWGGKFRIGTQSEYVVINFY